MLTLNALKEYGANVAEGLGRCMNNEAFYLRMVGMAVKDNKVEALDAALKRGDLKEAFELAHALKGMCANLSLTPLSVPLSEITEILRAGTDEGTSALIGEIVSQKRKLDDIAAD
ncbi:MAG: Hpt domain-containing protein [Clostridiales bacterium]|nr:Hpt domain-containing protein [Clostridiales bacterium]